MCPECVPSKPPVVYLLIRVGQYASFRNRNRERHRLAKGNNARYTTEVLKLERSTKSRERHEKICDFELFRVLLRTVLPALPVFEAALLAADCIEEQGIGRQRLSAILRPETKKNHPALSQLHFNQCGLSFHAIAAQQPPR